MAQQNWYSVELAPFMMLCGNEQILATRALESLKKQALERHPDTSFTVVNGVGYSSGELLGAVSPSLFAEPKLVIVEDVAAASDALITESIKIFEQAAPDVYVIWMHRGGNKGKRLIDLVKKQGVIVPCAAIKKLKDKQDFVSGEFTRAKRKISPRAVIELIDAYGNDLSELAAVCSQLMSDTLDENRQKPISVDVEHVRVLTAGRTETTAFAVADACLSGNERQVLQLLRQADQVGVQPVPLVGAVASKLRQLAKAKVQGSASELGIPEWQLRNLQRDARAWSDRGLRDAFEAVARADADVKGNSRDEQYALQRMVLTVCQARRTR